MQYAIIFKLLGAITRVLSFAFVLCLGISVWNEKGLGDASFGFLLTALVSFAIAVIFHYLGKNAQHKLFRKEALCVIGIAWILASLLGALPYWLVIDNCSYTDAFFESVSGFTTTGATVFTNYEERLPAVLLFWRALTQWIGGLGVVVLFVALISNVGSGAKVLFSNESSGQSTDIDDSTIKQGASRIMIYYLVLSAVCFIVYYSCGLGWFDALCHMLTTVSTGGFSTINQGVPGFQNPLLEWMMIFFMFAGGFSFLFAIRLSRIGTRALKSGVEVVVYSMVFATSSVLILALNLNQINGLTFSEALRDAAFQSITILTTTGYATEDFSIWSSPVKWILLSLMIIGGCSGSTAGGIKVIRVLAAYRIAKQSIEKTFRSNVVRPLKLNGKVLDQSAKESLVSFILLNVLVVVIGVILFSLLQPSLDLETGLSAVLASLFNIGPGLGKLGPMENFAFLGSMTKLGLCLLMLLGRLELYALLALLSPSLWRKFS
ncbi:MAG: TrkH family potassium uptake protein [Opitutales bacterium]|nr:TrkH family potassium uptake protein [Opitutales bacterium]